MEKEKRLDATTGDGGIADCGKALNCERVCPKEIPLVSIIGELNRQTTFRSFSRWLFKLFSAFKQVWLFPKISFRRGGGNGLIF